ALLRGGRAARAEADGRRARRARGAHADRSAARVEDDRPLSRALTAAVTVSAAPPARPPTRGARSAFASGRSTSRAAFAGERSTPAGSWHRREAVGRD